MKNILDKDTVLVVNRNWAVVDVKTPREAFLMMVADAATGFDVTEAHDFIPTMWSDWMKLPVRANDDFVTTPRQTIRVPRVIMAVNYAGVVVREKRPNTDNLMEHYGGECAITGVKLTRKTFSKEHVVPVSKWKGSARERDGWGNVVPAHRDVNSRRGNLSYAEAGLKAPKIKPAPKAKIFASTVVNTHNFPEWEFFIGKAKKKAAQN